VLVSSSPEQLVLARTRRLDQLLGEAGADLVGIVVDRWVAEPRA
jgi:hypothetical protein